MNPSRPSKPITFQWLTAPSTINNHSDIFGPDKPVLTIISLEIKKTTKQLKQNRNLQERLPSWHTTTSPNYQEASLAMTSRKSCYQCRMKAIVIQSFNKSIHKYGNRRMRCKRIILSCYVNCRFCQINISINMLMLLSLSILGHEILPCLPYQFHHHRNPALMFYLLIRRKIQHLEKKRKVPILQLKISKLSHKKKGSTTFYQKNIHKKS